MAWPSGTVGVSDYQLNSHVERLSPSFADCVVTHVDAVVNEDWADPTPYLGLLARTSALPVAG